MQALVIGDIHGSLNELKTLIKDVDRITTRIILIGDLIDRGDTSEGVIDFVRENNIECVKGNHEMMLIECIPYFENDEWFALNNSDWFLNDGYSVMQQYSSKEKLITDAKWLDTLPMYIETGIINNDDKQLLVSHAWVAQYNDIATQSSNFMFTWDRHQPRFPIDTPYYNIFGHTPVDSFQPNAYKSKLDTPKPIFYENACNVDTGCAYNTDGRRHLTGVFFPSLEIIQVELRTTKVLTYNKV